MLKMDPVFGGWLLMNKVMLMCKMVKLHINIWNMEKWLEMLVSLVSVEVW